MIEVTVTEFSRHLREMFDKLEHGKEEIILIRNNHKIARIIPGSSQLNAIEAMSDIFRTLSDDAAKDWLKESRIPATLSDEVLNPWDS